MKKLLQYAVTALLIMQVSELFRILLFVGLSLKIFASISILILYLFILINYRYLICLNSNIVFKIFFCLLILVPVLLAPIHYLSGYLTFSSFTRYIFNNLLYIGIFICLVILIIKNDANYLVSLTVITVGIILFGIVLDYIVPGLFYAIKLKVWGIEKEGFDFQSLQITRVGGFFLKSTSAASSLVLILPSLLVVLSRKKVFGILLSYTAILFLVLLTGSRSGLLVMIFIFPVIVAGIFGVVKTKKYISSTNILTIGFFSIPIVVATIFCLSYIGLGAFKPEIQEEISTRIMTLASVDEVSNDESVHHRTSAQLLYLTKIADSPFLGYGNEYSMLLKKKGLFRFSSHNSYIEITFTYGVFQLALFLLLIFAFAIYDSRTSKQTIRVYLLFGMILLSYGFFVNTLLQNRMLYFTAAILTANYINRYKTGNTTTSSIIKI